MKTVMLLAGFVLLAAAAGVSATSAVIHNFRTSEGQGPLGPPTLYQGNFYGTTAGGTNGFGNVYRLYPKRDGTYAFVDLHDFNGGTDGFVPAGVVAVDGSGNLFGVCERGGVGGGTVWELIRPAVLSDPWAFVLLASFDGTNGSQPESGMVYHDGAVWGFTSDSLFRLTPDQNGDYQFELVGWASPAPGSLPLFGAGGVVYEVDGLLAGAIYSFTQDQSGVWNKALVTAIGTYGSSGPYLPTGGALLDSTGAFYGMSAAGGAYQGGTIYKVYKDSNGLWITQTLRSFNPSTESYLPAFSLLVAKKKYYGILAANPNSILNEVFQAYSSATSKSWTVNDLQDFTSGTPLGTLVNGLTQDAAGNLYGTSTHGGDLTQCIPDGGCGVVWKITP